jgi:hypothetical protein
VGGTVGIEHSEYLGEILDFLHCGCTIALELNKLLPLNKVHLKKRARACEDGDVRMGMKDRLNTHMRIEVMDCLFTGDVTLLDFFERAAKATNNALLGSKRLLRSHLR